MGFTQRKSFLCTPFIVKFLIHKIVNLNKVLNIFHNEIVTRKINFKTDKQ
jgi:hypothetical protein